MNSQSIRKKFLDFFAQHLHSIVPSSSLIPHNDATLLFTNAGMVPFKDVFLGIEQLPFQKATSAQRCVRAGGKHNDLENVGYTARHHTFFEMLGNFSFGDYFKKEAIHFAWDFLTQELKLPKEKLWVTVFEEDEEAANIWIKEIGVDPNRLSRIGAKDNFWSMGDTGPCGPCSEIFYDHGAEIFGGPPGSPEEDGDRYIEIWNLVFMQYNRSADGTLTPLPKPSVDTGMGFERIVAVMQGVHNNYETDLFMPIIRKAAALAQTTDLTNQSLRVIADHLRATAFLIADGVRPSNEGRGYVLRRIMRRALRHGYQLGLCDSFFPELLPTLIEIMGVPYSELITHAKEITQVMQTEAQQFNRTLEQGMKLLDQVLSNTQQKIIPGETVFKLYDTYGFPVDLTADIARERGFTLDEIGFAEAMSKQKTLSKSSSKFAQSHALHLTDATSFKGYEHLTHAAHITGLYRNGESITEAKPDAETIIAVILDQTPFYAEAGGQVGDAGFLLFAEGRFKVSHTQKAGNAIAHFGILESGKLIPGLAVEAVVDNALRQATARNHSATHLLHSALKKILGDHVQQKGSLVSATRLRFDFSHSKALTREELNAIEQLITTEICANHLIQTQIMPQQQAIAEGAAALFGEKYGDEVRVLSMGDFSKELCGGTHAQRTGDIGPFKIIEEVSIAAGVRRIEAATGAQAIELVQKHIEHDQIEIEKWITENKQLKKELEKAHMEKQEQIFKREVDHVVESMKDKNAQVVALQTSMDGKQLRQFMELLQIHLSGKACFLISWHDERLYFIAYVSGLPIKANDWMTAVTEKVGGKGGGSSVLAQASLPNCSLLEQVIEAAKTFLKNKLGD